MASLAIVYLIVLALLGGVYFFVRWIQDRHRRRDYHRSTVATKPRYLTAAIFIPALILTVAWIAFLGWLLLRLVGFL